MRNSRHQTPASNPMAPKKPAATNSIVAIVATIDFALLSPEGI